MYIHNCHLIAHHKSQLIAFASNSSANQCQMADENMVQLVLQLNGNRHNGEEEDWDDEQENEEGNEAAFEEINAQLDQLNSALDCLEKKNDDIRAKLVELLHSCREESDSAAPTP